MGVGDVMTRTVIAVAADATVAQAIGIMLRSRISGLPVLDDDHRLVGILSESDLLRRPEIETEEVRPRWLEFFQNLGSAAELYSKTHSRRVGDVMTRRVVTTSEGASLRDAVGLMNAHRIKRLPVLFDNRVVGMLTRADILKALSPQLPPPGGVADAAIRQAILDELAVQRWSHGMEIDVAVRDGVVDLRGTIPDERYRAAVRIAAENRPGVRSVRDHLVWFDPRTDVVVTAPAVTGSHPVS